MTSRLFLTVLTCSVLLAACGQEAPAPAPVNPNARPVDAATAGMITGSVTFTGTPPPVETISMGTDQACVDAAGETAMSDAVLIGDDGSLENAFVYIKSGLDPDYSFETPTEEVVLDQDGCRYTPRVLGVRVGQTLKVLNSDPTMHNVHALPMENLEFNKSTPMEGTSTTTIFTVPEVMVRFMCNVHGWMTAQVGVMANPYFAVTGPDGSFSLEGVPPGTYTIEAWHEKFGTQTSTVTIGDSETGTTSFAFTNTEGS